MLVVGGYNSSNTCNLARICADKVRTFHIADPGCMVSADRNPPPAGRRAVDDRPASRSRRADWLPASGPVVDRPHGRRVDAEQHRRRSDQEAGTVLRRVTRLIDSAFQPSRVPVAAGFLEQDLHLVAALAGQEAVEVASRLDHHGGVVTKREIAFLQLVVGRGDLDGEDGFVAIVGAARR